MPLSLRLNPVALLASLLGIWALGKLPFVQPSWLLFKANRLVEGVAHPLALAGNGAEWLLLLWLLLLAISLVALPRRAWLLALLAVAIIGVTLLSLEQALSILQENLDAKALRRSRISLLSGAWLTFLAIYILLFATWQEGTGQAESGRAAPWWHKLLLLLPSLGLLLFLLARGSLSALGLSQELQSQGADFSLEVLRHLALSFTSVFLACLLGIPAAIAATRQAWLERLILPSAGLLQTIPSLALFGLLLAPLSRLGKALALWQALLGIVIMLLFALLCHLGRRRWLKARAGQAVLGSLQYSLFFVIGIFVLMVLALFLYAFFMALGQHLILGDAQGWRELQPFLNWRDSSLADIGIRGIGRAPALIALILYALLPIVRNTYTGIKEVPPAALEAGRGMGMSRWQILRTIELPLAFPLMMEGLRASLVLTIGIATVAFLIGADGLGVFIQRGIDQVVPDLILLGAIPIIILALLADGLLRLLTQGLTPRGIRVE